MVGLFLRIYIYTGKAPEHQVHWYGACDKGNAKEAATNPQKVRSMVTSYSNESKCTSWGRKAEGASSMVGLREKPDIQ